MLANGTLKRYMLYMSEMNKTIARELIERNQPLDGEARVLFGHGKPLGSRWHISTGAYDLILFKKTLRRVDLTQRYPDQAVNPKRNYGRLYIPSNTIRDVNPDFVAIFDGLSSVCFYTSFDPNGHGIIEIGEGAEHGQPLDATTADIGRMMLVDELIMEQNIRGCSRQVMDEKQAQLVIATLGVSV